VAETDAGGPIGPTEFAGLMDRVGPFESAPLIAVAVSGGADSMALVLLARHWAAGRGGSAVGLTVDHGLRPGSAREARQVKAWLARHRVAHVILRWRGAKGGANLQAEARAARYRLLDSWCRRRGALHLLLAHHREDQAETFLLRLGRGSGVEGLAAMAPVSETANLRLLRPLLDVPRARLSATLAELGQEWIEDPSNQDPRHARVRVRALLPALGGEGIDPTRLAGTARQLGRARSALEGGTAQLLARAVRLDPAGYARFDGRLLSEAPEEIGLRAVARVIQAVGGSDYAPRLEGLERLHREIAGNGWPWGRTLGGCRVVRAGAPGTSPNLLICREPGLVEPEREVRPGECLVWDGRFHICLARQLAGARGPVRLAALGDRGWPELVRAAPQVRKTAIPSAVRASLPTLRDLEGLLAVPHLNYGRAPLEAGTVYVRTLAFRPPRPLSAGAVTVA
jgi:tRNA(Ile)-lysidine synthase